MSLGLLVGLLFYAKTLDDVTTMLLLGSLFSLITLISLRAMSNGFRRWRDGCNGRIFLRLDRDGVHYWRYGMARYTPAMIPWAAINDVAADCWRQPKRGWLCTVNISWRPHANAVYLRHLRYNTTRSRDNREQTRDIAARIRANSPNHGQYDHLPRTYMDDVSGYTSFNPDNPP